MCQLQIRFHLHRVVCRSPPSVSRGPTEFHGMHRMSRGGPWPLHGRGKSQSVIPLFYILFYCVCVCVCVCVCGCVCVFVCVFAGCVFCLILTIYISTISQF